MGYSFKLGENPAEGFVRIGLEQIGRALQELADTSDTVAAVHSTRKTLKRLRALLRLGRPGLGERIFQRENARFRDIAALLSADRDRAVLIETAEKLAWRQGNKVKSILASLQELLAREHADAAATGSAGAAGPLARLQAAGKAFRKLRLRPAAFATLAEGLELSYRQGRRALRRAYETDEDEAFHDWRKGVQQHWRHMALLSKAWPDYAAARLAEARELSQILGDDHDLSVLASAAAERLPAPQARLIAGLCHKRQADLRARARPSGLRLFAEKPGALTRKFDLYWRCAQEIRDLGGTSQEAQESQGDGDGARHAPLSSSRKEKGPKESNPMP